MRMKLQVSTIISYNLLAFVDNKIRKIYAKELESCHLVCLTANKFLQNFCRVSPTMLL